MPTQRGSAVCWQFHQLRFRRAGRGVHAAHTGADLPGRGLRVGRHQRRRAYAPPDSDTQAWPAGEEEEGDFTCRKRRAG